MVGYQASDAAAMAAWRREKAAPASSALQFLHGAMQLAIEKGLYTRYDELQHDFHSCFVDKCGNDRLIAFIHQLNRSFKVAIGGKLDQGLANGGAADIKCVADMLLA